MDKQSPRCVGSMQRLEKFYSFTSNKRTLTISRIECKNWLSIRHVVVLNEFGFVYEVDRLLQVRRAGSALLYCVSILILWSFFSM